MASGCVYATEKPSTNGIAMHAKPTTNELRAGGRARGIRIDGCADALTCGDHVREATNLEHGGERFVNGATMGHVFDCKSKTG